MYIMDEDLKFPKENFKCMKYMPYEMKEKFTKIRINQWNDHFDGNVYVSFSGGIDSTVLLFLVRKYLGDSVPAVFSDTGLEFPEIREFVKTFDNVTWIKPKKNFKSVILSEGYPLISKETAMKVRKLRHGNLCDRYRNYLLNGDERGKLGMLAKKWRILLDAPFDTSERCCDIMKKEPFHRYHKETGRYPFIGITQDESFIRERQYNRTGCNIYDGDRPKSQPLGFWTKQDILRFVVDNNIKIASVYGEVKQKQDGTYYLTGEQRTGCMFCAFGCHLENEPNRFQRMQVEHPNQYQFCMKDLDQGGLGMKKVLEYVGIPYETWEGAGQMNIKSFID